MATPMKTVLGHGLVRRNLIRFIQSDLPKTQSSWTKIFKRQKEEEVEEKELSAPVRKHQRDDGPRLLSQLASLKKKTSLVTVRGYMPPPNVEQKVAAIAESIFGTPVDSECALSNRQQKFQILAKLTDEFDHQIPNTELASMNTLKDAVTFFSKPVRDQSSYEDLAKLDLPPNLHIQMEPLRFNAETDTFFEGQTAFPGDRTVVSSLRYGRKYKGNQGESRNERSLTEFERNNRS